MLSGLWSMIRRLLGLDTSWETMTFARVGVDPVSSRALTQVLQPVHTIRLRPERSEPAAAAADRIELAWHGITDIGMVRRNNEDSLAHAELGDGALFIVADGMGGHDAGEIASRIAAETVGREVRKAIQRNGDPLRSVQEAVRKANQAVRREAIARGSDMGTTLAVALVAGPSVYVANVGDSRVYWMENGSISQITQDHSLVAKLVAAGKLTKDEARTDARSHLLYRTIGSSDEVVVDSYRVPLRKGGTLLLCSDGLWGEVDDADLRRICSEEERTEVICARLVQQANANGGRDNITAIAVKIS